MKPTLPTGDTPTLLPLAPGSEAPEPLMLCSKLLGLLSQGGGPREPLAMDFSGSRWFSANTGKEDVSPESGSGQSATST